MLIGGVEKTSLVDYPEKLTAVVFTIGCNFRCGYCHNPELIKLKEDKKPNYKFFEIYREEGIDFEYNADRTEITYFWKITDSAII